MLKEAMNYFDHAATSPIYPEVLDILSKSLREDFANPSSQHLLGHALKENIDQIRMDFMRRLKAKSDDHFYFTSSATESNNTVIRGLSFMEGDSILFSRADHPSMVAPIEFVANQKKLNLIEIPLESDGTINLEKFIALLDTSIKLVALTSVNNQSGVINDIDSLARLVKEKTKAHIHLDAVQSFGKIPLVLNPAIDSLSITAHKIGGPKGIAGLFLKKNHAVSALLLGGGQENGFRSSTEAYPLILAFHTAMKLSTTNLEVELARLRLLNDFIHSQLSAEIPSLLTPFKKTSPYIFSFLLPGISSDIVLRHLERREIYISSTSACSSRKTGFNPSLFAMGIPEHYHKNFLRISLGRTSSEQEVERLMAEFKKVWSDIKHLKGK